MANNTTGFERPAMDRPEQFTHSLTIFRGAGGCEWGICNGMYFAGCAYLKGNAELAKVSGRSFGWVDMKGDQYRNDKGDFRRPDHREWVALGRKRQDELRHLYKKVFGGRAPHPQAYKPHHFTF